MKYRLKSSQEELYSYLNNIDNVKPVSIFPVKVIDKGRLKKLRREVRYLIEKLSQNENRDFDSLKQEILGYYKNLSKIEKLNIYFAIKDHFYKNFSRIAIPLIRNINPNSLPLLNMKPLSQSVGKIYYLDFKK